MNALLILYVIFFVMIMTALGLLAVPFVQQKKLLSKYFLLLAVFVGVFTSGLYYVSSNQLALALWLTQGKQHYALMEKVNALGGIDGLIARVKKKVDENPNDAQGWMILGKLYLSKQDNKDAAEAFKKARDVSVRKIV